MKKRRFSIGLGERSSHQTKITIRDTKAASAARMGSEVHP